MKMTQFLVVLVFMAISFFLKGQSKTCIKYESFLDSVHTHNKIIGMPKKCLLYYWGQPNKIVNKKKLIYCLEKIDCIKKGGEAIIIELKNGRVHFISLEIYCWG